MNGFTDLFIPNARAMLENAHLNGVFWEDAIATTTDYI